MIPKINSAHGSDTRNIINRVIEVLNQLGINFQKLVAEGQLTEEQYGQLLLILNDAVTTHEWEAINKRVDNLILDSGNSDVEVQDARNSLVRSETFNNIKERFEQLENEVIFVVENSTANSDFSDGYANWSSSHASGELDGIKYTSTGNGNNRVPRLVQRVEGVNHNDVFYAGFKGRALSNDIQFVDITLRNLSSSGTYTETYNNPPVGSDFIFNFYGPVPNDGAINFEMRHGYVDSTTAEGKQLEISKPILINLTKVFGAGNEPSKDAVDRFLSGYNDRYFNGSGNFYNVETMKALFDAEIDMDKVKDGTISTKKTNFIEEVNEVVSATVLSLTSFDDVSPDNIILRNESGFRTYRFLLEKRQYYKVILDNGSRGRFTVVATNEVLTGSDTEAGYEADKVVYNDLSGESNEVYFFNESAVAIYVTVGRGNFTAIPSTEKVGGYQFNAPIKMSPEFGVEYSAITNNAESTITMEKEEYPVLFGVKMSNSRTSENGYNQHPVPIGWLYYEPKEPYNILYSSGTADKMKRIFTWDKSVTWNGSATPEDYSPFITKNGDIVFVWRGEFGTVSTGRQNPIVYKNGDYENPIEVQLSGEKPTSWLQNCGADYIYNHDKFVFAEYTRPVHDQAHIWTVSEPIENPENWIISKSFPVEDSIEGVEHMHTVNYDTYSGVLYATSGDSDPETKILYSLDYGESWTVLLSGDQHRGRLLNFIFTKDNVYWSTDSQVTTHSLFEAKRDAEGILDLNSIKELYRFDVAIATYTIALIDKPHGLLLLNRFDAHGNGRPVDLYFWSFETNSMHIIDGLEPLEGVTYAYGFRNEAVSWYQSPNEKNIVMGFGWYPNSLDVFGNVTGDNTDRVANMGVKIVYK